LDVLQSKKEIRKFLEVPTSYGAIEKKGVPEAIINAAKILKTGSTYYIKSDIASFFTKVPRPLVLNEIRSLFPNQDRFLSLIERATNLEVENLNELERDYGQEFKNLFIFDTVGTPQGCSLSPLFGNIVLYGFDKSMNYGDIHCLRYLDDFIIFGPSLRSVNFAFKKAQRILSKLGLCAYDPQVEKEKAGKGEISKSFEFLGIEFVGKIIRPSSKSRKKLLSAIEGMIKEGIKTDYSKIENGSMEDRSFIKVAINIHNKIKGWGNQYYFCNDKALWGSLDAQINSILLDFSQQYYAQKRRLKDKNHQRRHFGVHLLIDSKQKPITW
jgi:hypothetical protein